MRGRVPQRLRLWSLSEHVLVEVGPRGDHLVAFTQWGEIRIDDVSPAVLESLQRMCLGPVSLENLPALRATAGDPGAEPWQRLRQVLKPLGNCVVQSLGLDDETGPLLSVAPVTRQAQLLEPPALDLQVPLRLSRFVSMRSAGGDLLLESPLAQHRVQLHRPLAAWVAGALCRPTTIAEVSAMLKIAAPVVVDIVGHLVSGGMVLAGRPGPPPDFAEDADPNLIPWSHHDLLFHSRSRLGQHNGHAGAVFPYLDQLPAAPVVRPVPPGRRFPLRRPDLSALAASDPPLTSIIEAAPARGSYSAAPLPADQLGELLFRVARIRSTGQARSALGESYPVSDRPYPSTSGLYELELYVTLDRCAGLPRGVFHYDPQGHAVTLIDESEQVLAELLDGAMVAAGRTLRPAALVTVTSRIARLSWMYTGIAYATTLKHFGMLLQTAHVVATAMGIVALPLVLTDGATSDEALRLKWPLEVSIGEFIVGV